MGIRLGFFVLAVVLARDLLDAAVREPFWGETSSTLWIFSYLHTAGPEILFFTGVGLVLPWWFKRYNTIKVVWICAGIFLSMQLVLMIFFSSVIYTVFIWYDYVMSILSPFAGILIGLFLGVIVSKLLIRTSCHLLSKRSAP
jgi:hypothetical protein